MNDFLNVLTELETKHLSPPHLTLADGRMKHPRWQRGSKLPADEYGLVIVYAPPADPGSYPVLDGDEEEHDICRLEAEHKEAVKDYHHYLGELAMCIYSTWIGPVKAVQGGMHM